MADNEHAAGQPGPEPDGASEPPAAVGGTSEPSPGGPEGPASPPQPPAAPDRTDTSASAADTKAPADLTTTFIQAFSVVGTVLGALASIAAFTAPFARTGSALIWTSVAVLAAALLLTAVLVGVYTYRGKRITKPVGAVAGLLVLVLAAGTGLGHAVWHSTAAPAPSPGPSSALVFPPRPRLPPRQRLPRPLPRRVRSP